MITDQQRCEFLDKLAVSARAADGVLLTNWESEFLASYIRQPQPAFFSPGGAPSQGRRDSVNRMWMKYGGEIGLPHPLDRVSEATPIAPADADGCEYIVRDEGRQRRCNEPAAYQRPNGFRYCENHAEAVKADVKRRGIKMTLIPFRQEAK